MMQWIRRLSLSAKLASIIVLFQLVVLYLDPFHILLGVAFMGNDAPLIAQLIFFVILVPGMAGMPLICKETLPALLCTPPMTDIFLLFFTWLSYYALFRITLPPLRYLWLKTRHRRDKPQE